MAFAYVGTIIFLFSQLELLISAQEQAYQTCPSSFNCNTLGVYGYPFTTIYYPSCGLCILNCSTDPYFTIRFADRGPWYDITYSFSHNKTFLVSDTNLLHILYADTCDIFNQSFHLIPRSSPSISFTIIHNEWFWKCGRSFSTSDQWRKRNNTLSFIHSCGDYDIYHDMVKGDILPNCTRVLYPDQLIVETSDQCLHCLGESGQCQDLGSERFKCIKKKKGTRKKILLVGLGGSFVIIVLIALVLWNLRKVKLGLPKLVSRNLAADKTRTDLGKSKMYFSLPIFSDSELEEATNNFDSSNELGDGGYGTVYYGKLKDGREVAVKRLHERNYRQLEQFMNEIQILTGLRHLNLVSLYGCTSRRSKELLLVYEYVPNGTVADHLYGDQAKCGILTWPIRMGIAIETAAALSYLHASDIIHRDVKSTNILLDNNFSVKVADFGLSRLFPTDVTHISTNPRGTPGYLDPQYHQCYQLTGKSDVYSFGVVLIELISSLPAVDTKRKDDEINLSYYALNRIQCCAFGELVDPRLGFKSNSKVNRMTTSVAELAFQCLQHKRELRPSMNEVLETLKSIESYDYEVVKAQRKEENDDTLKTQSNDDYVWLLSNAENPPWQMQCCTNREMNVLSNLGESSDLAGSEINSSSA